jgi:3'-5' exonuclease
MMDQLLLENFLVIDIETASVNKDYDTLDKHWQYLWGEKVSRLLPENTTLADYYLQRAGVMAEFAKVICISIGYFKKEGGVLQFRIKSFFELKERDLLQHFVQDVQQFGAVRKKWIFAGHNLKEFDIPFLCRRLMVNGLAIPSFLDFQNRKPWETNLVDTFQYWRFGDYKNYTSLQLLAAVLNIPSPKDDIDGSQVGHVYWVEKDLQRIVRYCQKDIITVANILLRFKNQPLLEAGQVFLHLEI